MSALRFWILLIGVAVLALLWPQVRTAYGAESRNPLAQEASSTPLPVSETSTPQAANLQDSALQTAAPKPDGSIVHTVHPGDTLIGIAAAYKIALADLLALNGLTQDAVIQPEQELLIQPAPTPTATSEPTQTPTEALPTPTLRPTRTSTTAPNTPTPDASLAAQALAEPGSEDAAQVEQEAASADASDPVGSGLIIAIVVLAAAGALLVFLGGMLRRRS